MEIQCDIENYSDVKHVFDIANPDIVFHFAANPITNENEADPTAITKTNVLGTHNVLAACQFGTRFVLASSATVYGTNFTPFIAHEENQRFSPESPYAATKCASEALLQSYKTKVNPLALRLVANVGAGAGHGVLPDVIRKLTSDSPTLDLLGALPGSIKQYTHVTDTAKAIVKLGLNNSIFEPLNISPGDQLSIEQLANVVMNTLNVHKPINWLGDGANWKGDSPVVRICGSRAKTLGYSPECDTSEKAIVKATKELYDGKV